MTGEVVRPGQFQGARRETAVAVALAACAAGLAFGLAATNPPSVRVLGAVIVSGVTAWMALSHRHHLALAMLMLWLGLFDGYVRLKSGTEALTLVRDLLLYAIVFGWLVRTSV